MKKHVVWAIIVVAAFVGCRQKSEDQIQTVMVEGIKHIRNPARPLKGTVILEVEKMLEINPYDQEEVGLRWFFSVKDKDGEVILFDVDQSEAHRFGPSGEYLGSLITHGQGPGEFTRMRLMYVRFVGGQIWVSGGKNWPNLINRVNL